ncbi:MAG: acyl-CoA dehydrogenase [Gemmatimonadetes bacterium]|nr:acyl-CoA dehydrogenase [Gemmatimonadota bacterium]
MFDAEGLAPDPVVAFLDEAHHELRDRATAFCRDELRGRSDPDDDDQARVRARGLVAPMGAAGLFEPIASGDVRGCLVVRETLAWWSPLADAVFALQGLSATPALLCGTDPGGWSEQALAGGAMGGFAMTEREAGSDVAALTTTAAQQSGGGWTLDGGKAFISNAGIADFYVVFASTDRAAGRRGISCFVVAADADGLEYAGPQVMSAPHPLGEIGLRGCHVGADSILGEAGGGLGVGLATLDRLRPTVAAAANGMAGRALWEATRHARTREQFGKPLASHQLVREKLARSATELTAGRLLAYRAGWEKDRGTERITVEAAMAKAFATEAAGRIVDRAVQVLGGRGVLASHPVDRLYRAVRALRIYEGTTEIQHLIVGGALARADGR